jgi:hypothetical protein
VGYLASGVGGIRLAKKALSDCARRKLKKAKARASKARIGGIQQPGNASAPKQGETSTGNPKKLRSDSSSCTETARPPKRPRDSSGPGNYKEALTNTKITIFKETDSEVKLTEHNQDSILEELGRVLRGTPIGELPHLKSYRLEGGALTYISDDQQSGQRLIRAIDNHRLGSGARLKATDARNLHKPVKVALRTRDKVSHTQDELLSWIRNLNLGLHTENWRVLARQSEPKCQRFILHTDRDSLVGIQKDQV